MIKKSDIEMEREEVTRIMRSQIRLKHTLAYYRELNDRLPDTLIEFDKAVQNGELPTLSIDAGLPRNVTDKA